MSGEKDDWGMVKRVKKFIPVCRAAAAVLWDRVRRKSPPWFVSYHVTSRCNLRCVYCYARYRDDERMDPSLEQIKTDICQLAGMGVKHFSLQGGEPLLRDDVADIVDFALQKKLFVSLFTNGLLLERHCDMLKRVHAIRVSLDGAGDANDMVRGDGVYEKVLKNLRTVYAAGVTGINFEVTVSRPTLDSWERVVDLATEFGGRVYLSEVAPEHDSILEDARLSNEESLRLWSRVKELKKNGAPIDNSMEAIDNLLVLSQYVDPFQIYRGSDTLPDPVEKFVRRYPCAYGRQGFYISGNGMLYRCARYFGVEREGYNVRETSVAEAYQKMRSEQSCRFCRVILNCQIGYAFRSRNIKTLLEFASIASSSYNPSASSRYARKK